MKLLKAPVERLILIPYKNNFSECALAYLAKAGIQVDYCEWTGVVIAKGLQNNITNWDSPAFCKFDILFRAKFRKYESILYLDADTITARTTDLAWYLNAPVGSTPVKVGQTRLPLPYGKHCVIDCHDSLLRRGYVRFYEQGHLQFIFYYNISKFDISGNDMENNQIHHFSSGLYMEKMKEPNSIWFYKNGGLDYGHQ